MSQRVLVDIHDSIATVTLNRADKYNAFDREMFDEVRVAGDELASRSDIRAVVLTGAGGNFSAGLDVGSFGGGENAATGNFSDIAFETIGETPANRFQYPSWVWHALPMPVIAAIDGVCFGAGTQVVAGADIRIATPAARFSVMEIKWGLVPDMGFTAALRHVMRLDHLKQLAYTGRIVSAAQAFGYGLVTEIEDNALEAAMQLAGEIAARSPDAVRATKHLVNHAWQQNVADGLQLEAEMQLAVLQGENQIEAVMANVQKREPAFVDASIELPTSTHSNE